MLSNVNQITEISTLATISLAKYQFELCLYPDDLKVKVKVKVNIYLAMVPWIALPSYALGTTQYTCQFISF